MNLVEELIFQYIEVRPAVSHPIKSMRLHRDGAFVLVRNSQNQWVLGRKRVYPEGMAKCLGGGIEEGNPLVAAKRELFEEAGVEIEEDRLVPLVHAEIFNLDGSSAFSTFVFYASIHTSLKAASDVDELLVLSDAEMHQFLDKFDYLTEASIPDDESGATWQDWGKVWGPIHRAAVNRAKELGL